MQRPSENQLENCPALDGRTRCGGVESGAESLKITREMSDWPLTGRQESDEGVLTGAGIFLWI